MVCIVTFVSSIMANVTPVDEQHSAGMPTIMITSRSISPSFNQPNLHELSDLPFIFAALEGRRHNKLKGLSPKAPASNHEMGSTSESEFDDIFRKSPLPTPQIFQHQTPIKFTRQVYSIPRTSRLQQAVKTENAVEDVKKTLKKTSCHTYLVVMVVVLLVVVTAFTGYHLGKRSEAGNYLRVPSNN